MPRLVSARFLPDDAELGARETREERRRRRLATREENRAARAERRQARIDARDRKRAAKRGGKDDRREQQRGRRRRTIEDAGKAFEAIDEATEDGGLLADYLPPGEEDDGEIEELPVDTTEGFGDDERWSPAARLGRMRIQSRRGVRAATIELRPGLYLVAEVPERALEGIGGPVKLAAKVVDAATHALRPKPALIPGPAPGVPSLPAKRRWRNRSTVGCEGTGRCRWETND